MASSSGSGGCGFQPGFIYKIISCKDRTSVEVENSSVEPGARIITQKAFRNAPHQKFKTDQVDDAPGEFRISAVLQPPEGDLVWDFIAGEGLVVHNTATGSLNQIWSCEQVHQGNKKVFYIKASDGSCLQNMGKGKQLTLMPKNPKESRQHWMMQSTEVY